MSEAEFKLVAKLGKRIAELEAEVERLKAENRALIKQAEDEDSLVDALEGRDDG